MSTLSFVQNRYKSTDAIKLSETTGYSRSHIVNVINGRRTNDYILSKAKAMVSRRKAK